jgi:hypothetical protein
MIFSSSLKLWEVYVNMNDVCAYVHEAVKFDFQQQSHHQCGLVKA